MVVTNNQIIVCPSPNCAGHIVIDTNQLLQGIQFECMVCSAKVSLSAESKGVLKDAMERFDETKNTLKKTPSDQFKLKTSL